MSVGGGSGRRGFGGSPGVLTAIGVAEDDPVLRLKGSLADPDHAPEADRLEECVSEHRGRPPRRAILTVSEESTIVG